MKDEERIPVSSRAEILPWLKSLIEENGCCSEYRNWIKFHDKTNHERVYIWCVANSFMVVLENRKKYYKLITAFSVVGKYIDYYNEEYRHFVMIEFPACAP